MKSARPLKTKLMCGQSLVHQAPVRFGAQKCVVLEWPAPQTSTFEREMIGMSSHSLFCTWTGYRGGLLPFTALCVHHGLGAPEPLGGPGLVQV